MGTARARPVVPHREDLDLLTSIPHVLEQHAEQGAFLWVLREHRLRGPDLDLAGLAALDARIDAHLEGLQLGGDPSWEICEAALHRPEPGAVFVAGVLAVQSGEERRRSAVLEVASRSYELSRGMVSALGWLPFERAVHQIERLTGSREPASRRMGIAAAAAHRRDPGSALEKRLTDGDTSVRARALRAVGELGRDDSLPAVRQSLVSERGHCRLSAAWTAALLAGDAEAVTILQEAVVAGGKGAERALQLCVRRLDTRRARAWLMQLAAEPNSVRAAVVGAGALGDPALAPWLIDRMEDPMHARVAGAALRMISGLDTSSRAVQGEHPAGFTTGPTDDPDDENVEVDPDESLPWPNRSEIRRWWAAHEAGLVSGERYLLGRPIEDEWLCEVLASGKQRERGAAALELAIRSPREPLFEVRAPASRQRRLLGPS